MERLSRWVERACVGLLWLAVVAGMLMTAFVVLAAIMRYFVGAPFRFTEELVGLLFIAVGFLGLPWATLHNRHLRITLIPERLPRWGTRLADAGSILMVIVFCIAFGMVSWDYAATSLMLHATTDMAGFALFPWMVLMPVVCAAMLVALGFFVWRRRRGMLETDEPPVV